MFNLLENDEENIYNFDDMDDTEQNTPSNLINMYNSPLVKSKNSLKS